MQHLHTQHRFTAYETRQDRLHIHRLHTLREVSSGYMTNDVVTSAIFTHLFLSLCDLSLYLLLLVFFFHSSDTHLVVTESCIYSAKVAST